MATSPSSHEQSSDKDAIIAALRAETQKLHETVAKLAARIEHGESFETTYAASKSASKSRHYNEIPDQGMSAKHVAAIIDE